MALEFPPLVSEEELRTRCIQFHISAVEGLKPHKYLPSIYVSVATSEPKSSFRTGGSKRLTWTMNTPIMKLNFSSTVTFSVNQRTFRPGSALVLGKTETYSIDSLVAMQSKLSFNQCIQLPVKINKSPEATGVTLHVIVRETASHAMSKDAEILANEAFAAAKAAEPPSVPKVTGGIAALPGIAQENRRASSPPISIRPRRFSPPPSPSSSRSRESISSVQDGLLRLGETLESAIDPGSATTMIDNLSDIASTLVSTIVKPFGAQLVQDAEILQLVIDINTAFLTAAETDVGDPMRTNADIEALLKQTVQCLIFLRQYVLPAKGKVSDHLCSQIKDFRRGFKQIGHRAGKEPEMDNEVPVNLEVTIAGALERFPALAVLNHEWVSRTRPDPSTHPNLDRDLLDLMSTWLSSPHPSERLFYVQCSSVKVTTHVVSALSGILDSIGCLRAFLPPLISDSSHKTTATALLHTILLQIASNTPCYAQELSRVLTLNKGVLSADLSTQIHRLFVEPLCAIPNLKEAQGDGERDVHAVVPTVLMLDCPALKLAMRGSEARLDSQDGVAAAAIGGHHDGDEDLVISFANTAIEEASQHGHLEADRKGIHLTGNGRCHERSGPGLDPWWTLVVELKKAVVLVPNMVGLLLVGSDSVPDDNDVDHDDDGDDHGVRLDAPGKIDSVTQDGLALAGILEGATRYHVSGGVGGGGSSRQVSRRFSRRGVHWI